MKFVIDTAAIGHAVRCWWYRWFQQPRPGVNCSDCGVVLDAAERTYYGHRCERCEGAAFHAEQEGECAACVTPIVCKRGERCIRDGVTDTRTCTCHPDDNPPKPCPRKFSLNECRAAAGMTPCQTEQECEVPALCKETGGCERMEAVCSRGCPSTEVCKAIRSGGECTHGVAVPHGGQQDA